MEENKEILQVKDLAVAFQTYRGKVKQYAMSVLI